MLREVFWLLLSALNDRLQNPPTNESPFLSVLMNFNTDPKITYLLLLKSCWREKKTGQESDCMHVEEHLLFSMNISAGPDGDKAKLNCSSEGMREKLWILNHIFLPRFGEHYKSTFKLWSFNFGMINSVTARNSLFLFPLGTEESNLYYREDKWHNSKNDIYLNLNNPYHCILSVFGQSLMKL